LTSPGVETRKQPINQSAGVAVIRTQSTIDQQHRQAMDESPGR